MSKKHDKIHDEALNAMVINALEFNAIVVQYATQLLANTGGVALNKSSVRRVAEQFKKLNKAYDDKYEAIIKDVEKKAGIKDE